MDADSRQIRELEEIAAFLRGEIRRRERDRIQIPLDLTETISMLRRTSEAVENEIERMQALRRQQQQPRSTSTLLFPFPPPGGSSPGDGRGHHSHH